MTRTAPAPRARRPLRDPRRLPSSCPNTGSALPSRRLNRSSTGEIASTPSPAAQRDLGARNESGPRTATRSGHAPQRRTRGRRGSGDAAGRQRHCGATVARSPTRTGRAKATSPAQRQEVHHEQRLGIPPDERAISRIAGTPSSTRSDSGRCRRPRPCRTASTRNRSPNGEGEVEPARNGLLQQAPADPSAMPAPSRCGATRPRISSTPSRRSARCHCGAGRRCCRVPEWRRRASPARCRRAAARSPMPGRRNAAVRS